MQGLNRAFSEFDENQDGKLSLREASQGIINFLEEMGYVTSKHVIMPMIAKLDEEGDGYVQLHEFVTYFDMSKEAIARREKPSLENLPCKAIYHGGARVATFVKDDMRIWSPLPQQDHEAANKAYDAVITRRVSASRFRVTFVHKRADPLAGPEDSKSILYDAFSDFPDSSSFIMQECPVEDLWMEVSTAGLAGLTTLNEGRLRLMQERLMSLLETEMEQRAKSKQHLYVQQFKAEMLEALTKGPRESQLQFMLGHWDTKYSLWQPPCPGRPAKDAEALHQQTKAKVELMRREIAQESVEVGRQMEAWRRVKKHQQSADLFVSSQVTLAMRYAGKPVPPVLIQAPELLGVNAPLEEGVTDVLKTVRSFFGDPNSKDPLEKQIKKKFDDADVDKSGALDKKEMKTLLRNTVNRGSERLSEHDMNNLIDILDADGSGSIEVEELLNAIKPRGSECPYDQEAALKAVAGMVDKVLILVDPQHTRFNPWEKHMIGILHATCRRKLVCATMVTAEHQNTFKTPKAILRLAHATAADIGAFLRDKTVERELRENVLSVGTVLDHTKARDGSFVVKGKSKASKDRWRGLPNALSRVVVSCFTHENEHARSVLRETCDSIRVLNNCLLKSWRYFTKHVEGQADLGEDEIQGEKVKLADAAHTLARAGEMLKKKAHKVMKELAAIDCTRLLTLALRLAKESSKTSQTVLKAIKMDGATTADKEKLKRDALERRQRVETAVRLGSVVEWTTKEHIDVWAELILERNQLDKDPTVSEAFKQMLQDKKIKRVGQLVELDRSTLTSFLQPLVPESERLKIWREVNRVRAAFWGLTIPTPIRSLWLLVREQFLCLEDLRLGYAILRGDVKIPDYWHTSFRDSLLLLTEVRSHARQRFGNRSRAHTHTYTSLHCARH